MRLGKRAEEEMMRAFLEKRRSNSMRLGKRDGGEAITVMENEVGDEGRQGERSEADGGTPTTGKWIYYSQ